MKVTFKALRHYCTALACALVLLNAPPVSALDSTFVIGFPQDDQTEDRNRLQLMAVQNVLKEHPAIKLLVSDGGGDMAKHIQNIRDMARQRVDLMIVSPHDTAALTPVIAQVRGQGIPVVLLSRRIMTDDYTSFVAPNEDKIAHRAAVHMAQELSYKGRVVILQGDPTDALAMKRTEAFLQEIAKYDDIEVVALKSSKGLQADALKVVSRAVGEGLQFDGLFAQSTALARAARLALKHNGLDPKTKVIIGIDYSDEAREAIRQGEQRAAFTYPSSGREGAELAVKILSGVEVARNVEVPSQLVTRSNVEWVDTVY